MSEEWFHLDDEPDEDDLEPLCPALADWFIHRGDVVEAKARLAIKAASDAGKPMSNRQITVLLDRARREAEPLRWYGACMHLWKYPTVTDGEVVERYAASVNVDLTAPGALMALCARLIRRHHPDLTIPATEPTPDHWPLERMVQLVLDVDREGDGPELERLERVRLNVRNDAWEYPGETARTLQRKLQEARRIMGIAAPRGQPPRIG